MFTLKLKFITLITLFIFVFCLTVLAQTNKPQKATMTKVGVVDTSIFSNEENGITDFVIASKKLESELKPFQKELNYLYAQIQDLRNETQILQNQKFPTQNKLKELEKLENEYNLINTNFDLLREKRKSELVTPVIDRIRKSVFQFAKQGGFVLILDKAKMDYPHSCDFSECNDITEDFIQFYNNDYIELDSTK